MVCAYTDLCLRMTLYLRGFINVREPEAASGFQAAEKVNTPSKSALWRTRGGKGREKEKTGRERDLQNYSERITLQLSL